MRVLPRTISICALSVAELLLAVGCQPMRVPATVPVGLEFNARLEAIRNQLGFDRWRENADWTVLEPVSARGNSVAMNAFRWTFDSGSVERALAESADDVEESGEAAANTNSAAEDGAATEAKSKDSGATRPQTWPRRLDDLLNSAEAAGQESPTAQGDALLRELAEHDDLIGWNAAILWARRNPPAAAATAPLLQRLVAKPPQYDPETKAGVWDPASGKEPAGSDPGKSNKSPAEKASRKPKQALQPISVAMRAAAAEAWCLVLAERSADKADALADAGRLLASSDLPVEVQGELFRGVGRWVSPAVIPRLGEALASSGSAQPAPVEIRRAAIEACALNVLKSRAAGGAGTGGAAREFVTSDWPSTIWGCQFDPDPHVRRIFGRWVALTGHANAFNLLRGQLSDAESSVRETALVSLGLLGTDEALDELKRQAARPEERVRVFALHGLAAWGMREVAPYATDESHAVRTAVVEELGRVATPDSALVLRELLLDSNPQVQQAVVEAISDWPDSLAVPLLLLGLQDSSRATRQQCLVQLGQRTALEESFPLEGTPDERAEAVRRIAARHNLPLEFVQALQKQGLKAEKVETLHAAEIESLLNVLAQSELGSEAYCGALSSLARFSADDLPVVERFLSRIPAEKAEPVCREVLPAWSPVYAALVELESSDVQVRRRAAAQIAQCGAKASLSAAAVHLLGLRLAHEQDELVWRYAVSAIMEDASEGSEYIALLAVNHAWPDIRILGCAYASRHGDPKLATALVPLLGDANTRVRLAAIEAAGRCRNPLLIEDRPGEGGRVQRGLRSLLTDSDRQVRFAAAVAMSRLGDWRGMQELVRLCADPNALTREEAVRAMGETGHTRFVEHLIRLGWTEQSVQVKRAILESLDKLIPSESRPVGLAGQTSYDTRIQCWVDWWELNRAAKSKLANG